ncbi:MAG TPA: alpha-glucuronidase family glycosyl hydrolase [Rhizomicrobium sp.]|jgi:alpha-glucuronidase|nr:alpha-glucuronidase family glycosyl hydrolase [Rhizomicrobium sp.]
MTRVFACLFALLFVTPAFAEDGYDLWLRYRPVEKSYRIPASVLVGTSPAATGELQRGLSGLTGRKIGIAKDVRDGAVVYGTPATSPLVKSLAPRLAGLGDEGYLIKTQGHVTIIAANSDAGVLYGAFAYLRLIQTRRNLANIDVTSAPHLKVRILDHWDNLDRTQERGYAGFSIWDWHKMPDYMSPRYTDYARADASIGINGAVLNNVAANVNILTPLYLAKVKALADVFRPWHIKVYLAVKWSAPIELGGLKTADPLDPAVVAWWKAKADEIYTYVPDFGGFLVKANSEGQPGPGDYHRSHADGANVLADALKPHGGIVMWRAFVYAAENPEDRAKQAYDEFVPLDGKFRDNVIVQAKNGAIDFQPREPFHPLFGALPHTNLFLEVQLTKEYLGLATSLAYLAPLYEEVLHADTYAKGQGSTVTKVIDGTLFGQTLTGMAGVSNVGDDRNWTGSEFNQANWYAFGRLAWDPSLSSRAIAQEWARQTFTNDPRFTEPVVDMMLASREAVVDYMTPLGLHHLMATGHHYGPGPWVDNLERPDWNPVYYHKADANGLGFDRTVATGSGATAQYAPSVAKMFENADTTPPNLLLWFHHVPWTAKLKSGRTLWDELVVKYDEGVAATARARATWAAMKPYVDAERFEEESAYLAIEEKEAHWWRDACLAYFETFSRLPFPAGHAPPPHDVAYYKAINFPFVPGH